MNGSGGDAPAGQQVNLALAAALLSGIRPTSITVDLAHDGAPAALTIDTPRGTEIKDTHRVFQALGITDPAVLARPEPAGRTRVDIDDSDTFTDPFGASASPSASPSTTPPPAPQPSTAPPPATSVPPRSSTWPATAPATPSPPATPTPTKSQPQDQENP